MMIVLINPALIITGIPFGLRLSKPDAPRPSTASGRTGFKGRVNRTLAVWLFCLALPAAVHAANIQVRVDRNPVSLNESFRLIFSADATPDDDPDFSPLQQFFDIVSQQRGSSSSWVNGKSSRTEQWILQVMPKTTGDLMIPPITFGSDTSPATSIKVLEDQAPAIDQSNDIFLQVEASPEQPYVQSQVLYTLKLYRRVQITQASLDEPDVKDAIVERLGEDSTYSTQFNGVDYWVTERKYAIFPQQSGIVTIPALTLTAEVLADRQPRFNGFFSRQITETRRVQSNALTLTVKAIPDSFKSSQWLNAESLQLAEQWSQPVLEIKVGEPLTRTLTLTAKGATVGQLPELAGRADIDGLKTYPDQPVLNEDKQPDGLVGRREEKLAYIASQPGMFTLPELTVPWFNTKTQQVEVAHIPAVTLKALPAGGTSASGPVAPAENPAQAIAPASTSTENAPSDSNTELWQGVAAFLALGWAATLLAGWGYMRKTQSAASPSKTQEAKPQAAFQAHDLQLACQRNDSQAAKQALLTWGKANHDVNSLSELAERCDASLRSEIQQLNRVLYSVDTADAWDGNALWQTFSGSQRPSKSKIPKDENHLEPLFRI